MDFIKDSAVKTVNGIKTEFAKTAKQERQNGETERQNGKTETGKTAKRPVKIETAKCKTAKPKWTKRRRQTDKTQIKTVKTDFFKTESKRNRRNGTKTEPCQNGTKTD